MTVHAVIDILDLREHDVLLLRESNLNWLTILILILHIELGEINVNKLGESISRTSKILWFKLVLLKSLNLRIVDLLFALN